MAKTRSVGRGALVKCNINEDGSTMVAVGVVTNITPPPQEKPTIDVTGMEDAAAQGEAGIEQLSEFSFESLHDPSDTTDDGIDTLYGNNHSVKWQVITIYGTTQTWTKEFTGRVIGIVPTSFDGNSPVKRAVRVVRTGAITDTVA